MKIDISIKCNTWNHGGTRTSSKIKWIVIHGTGNKNDTARANCMYFRDNKLNPKASAHFFVSDDDVYRSVSPLTIAYSVGGNKYPDCAYTGGGKLYDEVYNYNSLSIEMCSTNGVYTEKTLNTTAELVKKYMDKYGVDVDHVIRHFDVTGKRCPDHNGWTGNDPYAWYEFKTLLEDPVYYKTTGSVNHRDQAGTTDTKVLQNVKKGNKVRYLGAYVYVNKRKWIRCEYNGVKGWMSTLYLEKVN